MSNMLCNVCALLVSALVTVPLHAQTSEGNPMTLDSANQACLQVKDANTWTAYAGYMSGVGTTRSLSYVLANLGTAERAPQIASGDNPPAVGYKTGVRWSDADQQTKDWDPQGLTTGSSGSTDFALVAWNGPSETRISVLDTTNLSNPQDSPYRNVMLVQPTGNGQYAAIDLHGGGLALEGNYLYLTDFPAAGFRVFDLTAFHEIDGSNPDCAGHFGKYNGNWCADGYSYILPQVNSYATPTKKSNGAVISDTCKPKFSWAGKDTRPATQLVLSGEYCAKEVAGRTDNATRECRGDASGLNGRMYQWPLDSNNKLVTASGYVTPTKVYLMNERNVQGVAPDMVKVSGAFQKDVYWLSSTNNTGALFRVSPSASAASWFNADSQFPYSPEGMHASVSGTNLWIVTEGKAGKTDPATGGRVYISIDQLAVN